MTPPHFLSGSFFDPRWTLAWTLVFLLFFAAGLSAFRLVTVESPRLRKILWCALAACVIFRMAYPWIVGPKAIVLADGYYERAVQLYEGAGFSNLQSKAPTALEMPGYSLFLDGVFHLAGGPSATAALAAQVALGLLFIGIVYAYATVLYDATTALVAAAIFGFFPSQIVLTTLLQSDLFFAFCLWGGVAMFAKRRMASGVLFGLAALSRAYGLILVAGYLLWRFFVQRRRKEVLLVLGISLALYSPWVVRNFAVFHHFVPFTSGGGENLWISNHPGASGKFDGLPGEFFGLKTPEGELALDRRFRNEAVSYIRQKPLVFLAKIPKKWFFLLSSDSTLLGQALWGIGVQSGFKKNCLAGFANAYYLFFFVLAAWFCLTHFRKLFADPDQGFGLVLGIFLLGIFAVFHAETRFHIPLIPAISVYSAALITRSSLALLKP